MFIKKSNAVCIFVNLCSTLFSLWFKLSMSSALFCFFVEMHKRRGKKITGIKLNVDRQFSKFSDVNLCNLIEGDGAVPISRKNCHPFPPFPFINIRLSNEIFYIFHVTIFITTTLLPSRPPSF